MDQLIKRRGTLKSKITTFKKYINNVVITNPDESKKLDDDVRAEIIIRIDKANDTLNQYDDIEFSIDSLTDEVEATLEYRENFEQEYFSTIVAANKLLKRGIPEQQEHNITRARVGAYALDNNTIQPNVQDMIRTNSATSDNTRQRVKLPTIELPKFNGNLADWLGFRDTFESLIHENESISDIQKFHYLKASLLGTAGQIITSLEFSAANYLVAWNALRNRFNCNKLLIHNHIKAIFEIEPVKKESSDQIQSILDTLRKHLRALETLNQPVVSWDALIIYIISGKLDQVTLRAWEKEKANNTDSPTLDEFTEFLSSRAQLLQTLEIKNQPPPQSSTRDKNTNKTKAFFTSEKRKSCVMCKKEHFIQNCPEFVKLEPRVRSEKAKELQLCLNCLRLGHTISDCKLSSCRKCNGRHNTLLHFGKTPAGAGGSTVTLYTSDNRLSNVILPTALTQIFDSNNRQFNARLILDSCSQSNFMTERLCNALKLRKTKTKVDVETLNGMEELNIKYQCQVQLHTHHNSFRLSINCLVVPTITGNLPSLPIDQTKINIPSHLKLADPTFHIPGSIDLLIGGQCFWELLCVGQVPISNSGLILQKTKLGWVVGGPLYSPNQRTSQCCLTRSLSVDDKLERFWEIEEIGTKKSLSEQENKCEEIFANTVRKNSEGRFIVTIPLKESPTQLGDSKSTAKRRLVNLEKKLSRQPELKKQYSDFLDEYERLGHMSLVKNEDPNEIACYLPHHCVIKSENASNKIRVVFDGSAATSTGKSLNDIQMVGPTIQNDLFDLLIRFRNHVYVVSADIEKMYRQVLIEPEQRALQRILWRSDPSKPIQSFNLNTVTYGTAAASFLSIRSLFQLAFECAKEEPKIAEVILNDFYVDDLLTGANTIEEAKSLAQNVSKILDSGCFHLRKWASNEPAIIVDLIANDPTRTLISFPPDNTQKILGLNWDTNSDVLNFLVKDKGTSSVTKRQILSEIAQIFDPLGLVGPVIIIAKIILQSLWREKLSWDESVSLQLHQEWTNCKNALIWLNQLKIPRFMGCKDMSSFQLHGFADASKTAYGACVYVRAVDQAGVIQTKLLCSKSRVAPLKVQTIPRLELCGALLLVELIAKIKNALKNKIDSINYWTDSSIVNSWLRLPSGSLPVFISNRVSQIQQKSSINDWRHVPTKLNPADCLSRGLNGKQLINHDLWWNGPAFLLQEPSQWPDLPTSPATDQNEQIPPVVVLTIAAKENETIKHLVDRTSAISKAVRILAYVIRFIRKLQGKQNPQPYLTALELDNSLNTLIKICQGEMFPNELKSLQTGQAITKGKLATLSPFVDDRGVIRVGGRLSNAEFSNDKKYPIILDSWHRLTAGIAIQEHKKLLHAGPQHLLASLREKYWPIRGRNLTRKIVKQCTVCSRANPEPFKFVMGNLPKARISPALPFTTTGVDYAGPFLIRDKKGRGSKLTKCYIALFVCFVTKALHLELVSDLTKESFIAALRRFIARRGSPADIYSDNGSTFVGAHNELQELGQFLKNEMKEIGEPIENLNIRWHFIPAYSPHQGGIWEAGVKSVKTHLKRIAGDAHLRFEEFYTLLTQIEAVLNSRPLCPLSNDPNDLSPLTPAHFLVGRLYTTAADPSLLHISPGRLSNWQHVQSLQQHFWSRWQKEYVSELQRRTKWTKPYPNIEKGALVLIKENNLPPAKWKMGRIKDVHPGKDKVTRVASVQTSTGIIRRALNNFCPLPSEKED